MSLIGSIKRIRCRFNLRTLLVCTAVTPILIFTAARNYHFCPSCFVFISREDPVDVIMHEYQHDGEEDARLRQTYLMQFNR